MKRTLILLLLSLPAAARNPVYTWPAGAYFLPGPTPPGGVWRFEIRA